MNRKHTNFIKMVVSLSVFIAMFSSTVFAAWWGTPGYEWAREKGITSLANNSALNNKVSHDNFYSILINYLRYKNVRPKETVLQDVGESHSFNKAIDGIVKTVDGYIIKKSLTPNEYRVVATYIDHITEILNVQSRLIDRDDLKDVFLYLSLAKYKAATLIDEYAYRVSVLNGLGPVKYRELITYNIKPYYGDITRKEFLVLMYSLLSNSTSISVDTIINQFDEAGVLLGYNDDLMLSKNLTYAEMFTFMRRFETFDFNPTNDESNEEPNEDEIVEVR